MESDQKEIQMKNGKWHLHAFYRPRAELAGEIRRKSRKTVKMAGNGESAEKRRKRPDKWRRKGEMNTR